MNLDSVHSATTITPKRLSCGEVPGIWIAEEDDEYLVWRRTLRTHTSEAFLETGCTVDANNKPELQRPESMPNRYRGKHEQWCGQFNQPRHPRSLVLSNDSISYNRVDEHIQFYSIGQLFYNLLSWKRETADMYNHLVPWTGTAFLIGKESSISRRSFDRLLGIFSQNQFIYLFGLKCKYKNSSNTPKGCKLG